MENHITPSRIANSIQQDKNFTGFNILVEGKKDIKLYRKLTCKKMSKIKVTFGKKKMREVYRILDKRGFSKVLGIRDADFIRINDDGKFDPNYCSSIFLTDNHDSEGMILQSEAFEDFLLEVSQENNIDAFNKKYGNLRVFIYNLSYSLACLRLANKKYNLGLAFKPVKPNGNILKFKKFICEKKLIYLGHEKLINTVVEYSTNRGSKIESRELILEKLQEIIKLELVIEELVNGHDLAEILFIICKKGLKSRNESLKGASSVETMLRLAYSREHFQLTRLFRSLVEWQKTLNINIFSSTVGWNDDGVPTK